MYQNIFCVIVFSKSLIKEKTIFLKWDNLLVKTINYNKSSSLKNHKFTIKILLKSKWYVLLALHHCYQYYEAIKKWLFLTIASICNHVWNSNSTVQPCMCMLSTQALKPIFEYWVTVALQFSQILKGKYYFEF